VQGGACDVGRRVAIVGVISNKRHAVQIDARCGNRRVICVGRVGGDWFAAQDGA
jgi:hypothetical protein